MNKVGIITYHAAYNYGSVMQALATQYTINKLGYNPTILNYRMKKQKDFYTLYRTKFGFKSFVKDIMQLPIHKRRKNREKKFESFFEKFFVLSKEFSDPSMIKVLSKDFDCIISGSDQLWNKHSCEFESNSWEYMYPYLLKDCMCKKISYASSIAQMTDEELGIIIPYIKEFSFVSMRESTSAERLEKLTSKKTYKVLDPTFLLDKQEWISVLGLKYHKPKRGYILYYSLDGINDMIKRMPILKEFSNIWNMDLQIVTPFSYLPCKDKSVSIHPEYGPLEFMNALLNAEVVITDSYHGTILSMNFNKNFFSLCKKGGAEFRKTDILNRVGAENRAIFDINDIFRKKSENIDYCVVNSNIEKLRKESKEYLIKALG